MIRRYPVTPVIGNGLQRLQPIPVEQVAEGFARAVALDAAAKHIYPVGGPEAVTMLRLLDLIGAAVGRPRLRKIHVPIGFVRPLARALHRLPAFPLTPDQLLMLEEDNVCDPEPFFATFGLIPVPVVAGLRAMLS
jgi:NADH dehydrogenase